MAQFDIANPIAAYSTHFFPADAGIPVLMTVYKTGSASYDDVAGYLVFAERPMQQDFCDRLIGEHNAIVKHFHAGQLAAVQTLLQHRLDTLKQPMSIHYVGDELVGGWTTLDAGASPGLEQSFQPLVVSAKPTEEPPAAKAKGPAKKSVKKK